MQTQNLDVDLSKFNQIFLEEAAELLQDLESGLLALNTKQVDTEHFHAIFRAVHSIKGNAGMTGWEAVAEFTHIVEGILDDLRNYRKKPEPHLVQLLLAAVDHLKQMLSREPSAPLTAAAQDCIEKLAGYTQTKTTEHPPPPPQPTPETKTYRITWTPPSDCLTRGVDPIKVLSTLHQIGAILSTTCATQALPTLSQLNPQTCHLTWNIRYRSYAPLEQINDVFTFQALDENLTIIQERTHPNKPPAPAQTTPVETTTPANSKTTSDTVRVAAEKLDGIFNLVGEMVITQSMATQTIEAHRETLPQLESILEELKRQTRELQDRIMSLRLVPVEQAFRRFPRLVHDLSQQLGKQIHLEMTGTETEIDRALVEQLSDPLVHLMRNCADHGIETAEERIQQGKKPIGRIRLSARCQGGSTIVELEDDGRGLNTERIRDKALKLGLIQPQTKQSEKQLQSLIFHPGFSTADKVTSISGRGVGMDAVKKSVESASGSIAVQSHPGKGSKFIVHLPMTMAILDGLLVSVGNSVLVLPLVSVIECTRPRPDQLRKIPTEQPDQFQELLVSRNNLIPVFRLSKLLDLQADSTTDSNAIPMAILIEHNSHQFAILADEILGQQQVVIKSLETNYRRIDGLQGATILGDGRVALVVDFAALTRLQERITAQIANH